MKKLFFVLASTTLISFGSIAADYKQQEPVEELFEAMQADKMIDTMYAQMGAVFQNMQKQMGVQADEMHIFEKFNKKMIEMMQSEMSWQKMEPDLKQIYKQNFTEAEIQGLLAFYKSPVGKSFVEKMPAITQESMMLGQQMAMNAMPQIQALAEELSAELIAYREEQNKE